MILAANQPYLFPYLGYWQLINAADVFLIGDDYAYMRKSWINRNRVLINGQPQWFRMEVEDASSFRLIIDTKLKPIGLEDKLRTLEMAYHKAPYFADAYALARRVLCYDSGGMLTPFLENSIREVCGYLGIDTHIGHTSNFPGNAALKREQRIYDFCHRLGADVYINAPGGQELYDFDDFREHGIELRFLQPELRPYPQFGAPFVPSLSILDVLMFNSREAVHDMLSDCSFSVAANPLSCPPPVVTVVCVTYNHAPYIRDALEGFVMQKTSFPFEVIVHDDASTDGTADIVREYERKYPGIIHGIYQKENQYSRGVAISKEFIYPQVRGKYVALCEGDDYWTDPLKLQKQVDALEAHPELDSCTCRVLLTKHEKKSRFVAPATKSRVLKAEEVILGGGWFVSTPSLMCRREVYLQITPMREVMFLDYVLQIQASLRGGMYYIEDCMAVYRRLVPGSWSATHRSGFPIEKMDRMLQVLDQYTDGRFHETIDMRRRINRSKRLLSKKKYLQMLGPKEIRVTLTRLKLELRRALIKLHYAL
jgi:glycosyltransferase involved in cell wall biosynthesis